MASLGGFGDGPGAPPPTTSKEYLTRAEEKFQKVIERRNTLGTDPSTLQQVAECFNRADTIMPHGNLHDSPLRKVAKAAFADFSRAAHLLTIFDSMVMFTADDFAHMTGTCVTSDNVLSHYSSTIQLMTEIVEVVEQLQKKASA